MASLGRKRLRNNQSSQQSKNSEPSQPDTIKPTAAPPQTGTSSPLSSQPSHCQQTLVSAATVRIFSRAGCCRSFLSFLFLPFPVPSPCAFPVPVLCHAPRALRGRQDRKPQSAPPDSSWAGCDMRHLTARGRAPPLPPHAWGLTARGRRPSPALRHKPTDSATAVRPRRGGGSRDSALRRAVIVRDSGSAAFGRAEAREEGLRWYAGQLEKGWTAVASEFMRSEFMRDEVPPSSSAMPGNATRTSSRKVRHGSTIFWQFPPACCNPLISLVPKRGFEPRTY
ncbi:MAG: hypothetical protein FD149_2152 [Rhodospirillaceae bacterium]|nr:MAG: hypothetical protein FD149_2152 [Rhodospirillaceae bacterium]